MKIIKRYKRAEAVPQVVLEKHAAKYFFITNNYAKAVYLTANDFRQMLKGDINQGLLKNKQAISASTNKLYKKYKLTNWHKKLLYVVDEFFGIQDIRKRYVLISNYYQFKFLKECERRVKVPFKLLQYSVYPEFNEIFHSQLIKRKFKSRNKVCVCLQTNHGYEIISGSEAVKLLQYMQNKGTQQKEIKGIVASNGKAKGRVRVILKTHDMVNMKDGDILVSSMTRPEMLPAIKRASAIVTDEGGITCHAAIVSRELGIPCIIGTKNATRILHDGDMVEVDATKGIVKKI